MRARGGQVRGNRNKERTLRGLLGDEDYYNLVAIRNWAWAGPVTFGELIDIGVDGGIPWPSEFGGVYLVSGASWERKPDSTCGPLYVGSSTALRTRIGSLLADAFGFFVENDGKIIAGHSAGGQSLYRHCRRIGLSPRSLHIGWVENTSCLRCAEDFATVWLEPSENKIRSPRCREHHGNQTFVAAFRSRSRTGQESGE